MKVAVSVHGRFHAFELAKGLLHRDHLAGLLTTYPGFAVRRVVGPGAALRTAPWLEFRRRLCQRFPGACTDPSLTIGQAFGRFAARNLPPAAALLVGWSGATLEAIPAARDRGMAVVLERGSTHIQHQTEILTQVFERQGLSFADTSPAMIEREMAEYAAADAIAVPSSFAADTFVARGIAREKLIVNPYGVDLSAFSETERPEPSRPRILFVGRVSLRKGVPEVLAAFQPRAGRAELPLVGPMEPTVQPVLRSAPMQGVTLRGPVPMDSLPGVYGDADIFCLPSWEEGFPLVLLQAMASGLPVVASRESGAGDIMEQGREGLITAAGDVPALTDALAGLIDQAETRRAMGAAARRRVASGHDWQSYADRAIGHYETLLSAGT